MLKFEDFASADVAKDVTGSILISAASLNEFFKQAEVLDHTQNSKGKNEKILPPNVKKRRRESTPPGRIECTGRSGEN